jgi:hypothetical protein
LGGRGLRPRVLCGQYHWVFALVNLILTKRQARWKRAKTAKNGAKAAKMALTAYGGRTLIRDNTVSEAVDLRRKPLAHRFIGPRSRPRG